MGFVTSYDLDHFSIPQATVCTRYLQKAMYLLHKQLLYWSPTFIVTNLRGKLSISNTSEAAVTGKILTHTQNLLQKSHHTFLNQRHTLFPSGAQISFTKIPHGPSIIKKMTLVSGCHRSAPTKQPLEM